MIQPPRNPSPAYTRFKRSMMLDYDAWRDVEALRVLATPKALQRVGAVAETQTDGGGIEAFSMTWRVGGRTRSRRASSINWNACSR